MPPLLALGLTVGLMVFLLRREAKEKTKVSSALWIPVLWFWISGSRFISQWLTLGQNYNSVIDEGSPIDAVVFFGLIICGLYVLSQRRVTLQEFARNNSWLTFFFVWCLLAILWSDFPFIAAKRWIKILGHPIMAMVVLTDPEPQAAFVRLMKRSSYFLILFSVLLIKYFPQYGRGFDWWSGFAYNQGVTHNKNELGYDCMICGLFYFWNLLQALKMKERKAKRSEIILSLGFLGLIFWLLKLSSSATSLLCVVMGSCIMLIVGLPFVNKRHIGVYFIVLILGFIIAEPIFGIYSNVLQSLGRDATLTDRTEVWHDALALQGNPLLGAGFESFWLGDRLAKLWAKWWWHPLQAHNGYIEMYLNLGIAGLTILAGIVIGTFGKIRNDLLKRFEFARLRLAFLCIILIYNFTEATFSGVHLVWTVFYLIAIDYPRKARTSRVQVSAATPARGYLADPVPAGEDQAEQWRRETIALRRNIGN